MDRRCESIIRLMNSVSKHGIHKYANCEPKIKSFELHSIWKENLNEFEPLLTRLSVFHYTLNCTALLASEIVEECNAAVSLRVSR